MIFLSQIRLICHKKIDRDLNSEVISNEDRNLYVYGDKYFGDWPPIPFLFSTDPDAIVLFVCKQERNTVLNNS